MCIGNCHVLGGKNALKNMNFFCGKELGRTMFWENANKHSIKRPFSLYSCQ